MKRQTPIQLEDIDRKLLADEAARLGTSWAAVIRRLIREHLSHEKVASR